MSYKSLLQKTKDFKSSLVIKNHKVKKPLNDLVFEPLHPDTVFRTLATSFDGVLYGLAKKGQDRTKLFKSTDGGKTIQFGQDVSSINSLIMNMCVFKDGTIVFVTSDGKLLHMESFDAATYTVAQQGDTGGFDDFSLNYFDDGAKKIVLAGEYSLTSYAKKIWFSEDGGRTYTVLKIGDTFNIKNEQYSGNNHWHCVVYDQYSDMIWASQGDGLNTRIYYTFDKGVTWDHILTYHPTLIHPMPDRVIFGRDSSHHKAGFSQWVRTNAMPIVLEDVISFANVISGGYFPYGTHWSSDNPNEFYMNFPPRWPTEKLNYMYATGDGGESWHLVLNDDRKIFQLTGKDINGYLFAVDDKYKLLRARAFRWG